MTLQVPPGCRTAPACLDYRAFLFPLSPSLPETAFARLRDELKRMGRIRREGLGVTYVDGDWGFLVIPPFGFPELKINFYHGVPAGTAQRLLDQIARLLAEADAASPRPAVTTSPPERN